MNKPRAVIKHPAKANRKEWGANMPDFDLEEINAGNSQQFTRADIERAWPHLLATTRVALEGYLDEVETPNEALEILVVSARLYLAHAEYVKEAYRKGLH